MASASNSSVNAGARPRPRHGDLLDAAVGTGDARRPGMQECLMLEEVEVPPGLHRGIVHGAVGFSAVRTGKASALGEIDLDVEASRLSIEVGSRSPSTAARGRERVAGGRCRAWGIRGLDQSWPPVCRRFGRPSRTCPQGARKCASLTAIRPDGETLCQQDQAAIRPLSNRAAAPTRFSEAVQNCSLASMSTFRRWSIA